MRVAKVTTEERSVYVVRVADEAFGDFPLGPPRFGRRATAVVSLDYGIDACKVLNVETLDLLKPGARVPAFVLERLFGEDDAKTAESNKTPAAAMTAQFLRRLKTQAEDVRIVHSRMSLGGKRLFVRYSCESARVSPAQASAEIFKLYGVWVNAWQLGPRDVVGLFGAIGQCGRECCCATWQKRYPAGGKFPAGTNVAQVNGTCGRWKCCVAFERES